MTTAVECFPCRSGKRQPSFPPSVAHDLRRRARNLLDAEIDFIASKSFQTASARDQILGAGLINEFSGGESSATKDLPAHLARLCETKLLTATEEQALFAQMNYLKFRANILRSTLDPDQPNESHVKEAESLLARARQIRDHLIAANIRLVMSIAKKFVTPQHSFDDLLSEGIWSLMQAVAKFDFERGFRFSTYAYRAIARSCYRSISDRQKLDERCCSSSDPEVFEVEEDGNASSMNEHAWERLRSLMAQMVGKLDRRERFIIRRRYSLGRHRTKSTFQSLADKLGISKERVRQLEHRALAKMQAMAAELAADDKLPKSVDS